MRKDKEANRTSFLLDEDHRRPPHQISIPPLAASVWWDQGIIRSSPTSFRISVGLWGFEGQQWMEGTFYPVDVISLLNVIIFPIRTSWFADTQSIIVSQTSSPYKGGSSICLNPASHPSNQRPKHMRIADKGLGHKWKAVHYGKIFIYLLEYEKQNLGFLLILNV